MESGYNTSGQLGDGTTTQRLLAVRTLNSQGAVKIAVGANTTLLIMGDGTIKAAGAGGNGQLGTGLATNSTLLLNVIGTDGTGKLQNIVDIASGITDSYAIDEDGKVMQDGQEIDILRIADFNKPYRMTRMGDNYYRPIQPNNPVVYSDGFMIKQGYLEGSNVDSIKSMVDMISSQRTYDFLSKAIQSEDALLEKTVNQVGRVG